MLVSFQIITRIQTIAASFLLDLLRKFSIDLSLQTFLKTFNEEKQCFLLQQISYFPHLLMRLQEFDTLKIQLLSLLILLKFISCLQIILDLFFIIHSLAQIKLFYLLQVEPFFNPPLQIFSAENVFHFESFSLDNLITFILNLTRFIRFSLAL